MDDARPFMTGSLPIRAMRARDAGAVAKLHAESWRATYRGILDDAYLAEPVFADRLKLWRTRLRRAAPGRIGLVAVQDGGAIAGFAYASVDADPERGTLIDNLHVAPAQHGRGTGRALLHALAAAIVREGSRAPVHLWAYEANRRTRAFYERLGAMPLERALASSTGGNNVAAWCYGWPSATALRDAAGAGCRTLPRRLAR